jgi:NAD(P)H dehydrogenase (quinone)
MSKSHHHHHHHHHSHSSTKPESTAEPMASKTVTGNKARINVIYYSMYGHVAKLAKTVLQGIEAAGGEGRLIQVPETLSNEVLGKMHAPEKDKSVPTISLGGPAGENTVTLEDALVNCDGILFGIPT